MKLFGRPHNTIICSGYDNLNFQLLSGICDAVKNIEVKKS